LGEGPPEVWSNMKEGVLITKRKKVRRREEKKKKEGRSKGDKGEEGSEDKKGEAN